MEKTEMMKRYEETTYLDDDPQALIQIIEYLKECIQDYKAKATAYDRLMSGGKKTPKEVANFLGFPIAMNKYVGWYTFPTIPIIAETGFWYSQAYPTGKCSHSIPIIDKIDFNGDWEDSLTLPDGWEEQ